MVVDFHKLEKTISSIVDSNKDTILSMFAIFSKEIKFATM